MTSIPPFESLWSCDSLKPQASEASFAEKTEQKSVLLAPGFREVCQTGPSKHVLSSANIVLANDTFTENGEDKSLLSHSMLKLMSDPSSWNLSTERNVFPTVSSEHGLGCSGPISLDPPAETTRILEALTFQSSLEGNCSAVSTLQQVDLDSTCFSDDLSARFHSHQLGSSSSAEIMSMLEGHLQTAEPPLVVSTSAVTAHSFFPGRECSLGSSMTFPKIRTPSTPRDSIQLAKRHHSQPQSGANSFHRVMHLETSTFQPITDPPVSSGHVEETDIDDDGVMEKMETECGLLRGEAAACEGVGHFPSEQREAVSAESGTLEPGCKPPTPPLHRFPSWVRDAWTAGWECSVWECCLALCPVVRLLHLLCSRNCYLWVPQVAFLSHQVRLFHIMGHCWLCWQFFSFIYLYKRKKICWKKRYIRIIGIKVKVKIYCIVVWVIKS